MSFTPGLHGPRVLLTIPKTFDDFEVISVICFAQDNLESNFTPRYKIQETLFYVGLCTETLISSIELVSD